MGRRFFFGEAADGGGAGVLNVGEGDADVAGERGFDGFVDLGFDFQRFGVGEAGFGVLRFKANLRFGAVLLQLNEIFWGFVIGRAENEL